MPAAGVTRTAIRFRTLAALARPLIALLVVAAVGHRSATALAADPPAPRTKILLIGADKDDHPRLTHEYMQVSNLLAKCLRQTPGVEAVVSNRWPADAAQTEGIKAIVVYVPWGSNILFDGPHRDAVKKLLDNGVGLSAVHWGTGAQGEEFGALWLQYLGAWFHTDFSKIQHIKKDLTQADPGHAINRGWQNFELFDEYYFDLKFAPGARPLITVDLDGKPNTVAWTYERPDSHGGRSFGFDAGHYHKNFGDDRFRRIVINGILWTAHRELPPGGAPAAIEPADLEIPAAPADGK